MSPAFWAYVFLICMDLLDKCMSNFQIKSDQGKNIFDQIRLLKVKEFWTIQIETIVLYYWY